MNLRCMRRGILLAAGLSIAAALTACGGDGDSGGGGGGTSTPAATPPAFKLTITKTEDVAGTYGSVGAYERVTGTFTGEVDPADAKNTIITDLSLAPLNANGKVEYTSDFVLLKPKDMSK